MVRLEDTQDGSSRELDLQGVFVAIGHVPNTKFLDGALETDDLGYLVVGPGGTTKLDGVWAAGDVADHVFRQAITAAGMGCQSAISAERWLEAREAAAV